MRKQVVTNNGDTVEIDNMPNSCPFCALVIHPLVHFGVSGIDRDTMEVLMQCPDRECMKVFTAEYQRDSHLSFCWMGQQSLGYVKQRFFSEIVEGVSENFIEIYNQAYSAEQYHLNQISGVGYRKALEFLIKDYCILKDPEKSDKIKSKLLGSVIVDHIGNENIKNVASRAVWLGNDETHYVRRWEEKNVQDLKKLIDITVHWIEMEEETARLISDMPAGKN